MNLPPELARTIAEKTASGWHGKIAINFKDGRIQSFEVSETTRISRDPRESASSNGGSSRP